MTERTPSNPGLDAVVKMLYADPKWLRGQLRQAQAKVKELEATVAEKDEIIAGLVDRLSEVRRGRADA